MRRFTKGY